MFKRKSNKILLGILTSLIIVLGALEVKSYLDTRNRQQPEKVTTKQIGPYTVNATQTEYQKDVEVSLLAALEANNGDDIMSEVSKYFISDYFTLKDKTNFNNVGGLGFIFPDTKARFKVNAIDSYYRDLSTYIKAYGNNNLPLVTKITVGKPASINTDLIDAGKDVEVKKAYDVSVVWEYQENDVLDNLDVVTQATLRFAAGSDDVWYIYEIVGQE